MKLLKNQILFKPLKTEGVTQGGLFVPDNAIKDSDKGVIVQVGPGTKDNPMYLKEGQIGFRVHNWGTLIEKDGETFYLMEDNAILATI